MFFRAESLGFRAVALHPRLYSAARYRGLRYNICALRKSSGNDKALKRLVKLSVPLRDNLSIVGRKGQLDELEESLQKQLPDFRLQKSETQLPADGNGYLDTEKLLQVIAALLPKELWWKQAEYNKTYTYHAKAVCLRDFQEIYKRAKDLNDPDHRKFQDVYRFYLDV